MFGNKSFLILILGALGLPVLWHSDYAKQLDSGLAVPFLNSSNPTTDLAEATQNPVEEKPHTLDPAAPQNLAPVTLQEAFSYQVTPAWILGRWDSVTVGLSDPLLQGYRVPLVTAPNDGDLAGSLSYYFDAQQRVRRITFFGTTGDARPLVSFLTQQHQFQRVLTSQASQYIYEVQEQGQVISKLTIQSAPFVERAAAHTRFDISLTMTPPGSAPNRGIMQFFSSREQK